MRTAESSPAVRTRVGSVRTKGPVRITMGTLEWYLKKLERDGLKKTSIVSYRSALMKLYERLHDGVLDAAAIEDWEAWMQSRDLSPATLQMQKATLNGFLRYLDRPE